MKKITILITTLLLALGVLTFVGCESSNNSNTPISNDTAQALAPDSVDTVFENSPTVETKYETSEVNQYCTIRFDANGGQGYIEDMTVKVGATIVLPNNYKAYTKKMHRFVGFSRTADSNSAEFLLGACFTTLNCDPITLYAVYESNSATVQICKNDDDIFGEEQSIIVAKGAEFRVPESPFSKDFYAFVGYSRNPSALTAEYQVGDYIFVTDELKLYPVWVAVTYKLIIVENDGERVVFDMPYGNVTLDEIHNAKTKEGHSFEGYATSSDSQEVVYMPEDTFTLDRNIVLYAIHKPLPLRIEFVTEDEYTIEDLNFIYGQSVVIPECPYDKPYHKFLGYSIEGPDSTMIKYTPGQEISPTTDLNLYPVWGLKTTVKRGLTQSVRISGDYVAKVDFSEVLDVSALYEAGYVNYRVTVEWQTSKIKGHKARGDLQLFRSYPDSNYNPFDFSGSTIDKFNTKYRILNKDDFSIGQSLEISTPYRSTAEILDEQAFFIHFLSTGSSWIDVIDNDYRLESCVVTLQFYQ